jgi:predicted secreted protein
MLLKTVLVTLSLLVFVKSIDIHLDLRQHYTQAYEHTVHLDVGSYLYIVLGENSSTGYHYEAVDANLHKNHLSKVLRYAGTHYTKDESHPGVTGVGGTRTIRFEVIGTGCGNLELFYSRLYAEQIEKAYHEGRDMSHFIDKIIPVSAEEYEIDMLLTGGLDRFNGEPDPAYLDNYEE